MNPRWTSSGIEQAQQLCFLKRKKPFCGIPLSFASYLFPKTSLQLEMVTARIIGKVKVIMETWNVLWS